MLKHKFNAVRCESDGFKFASKKERTRYLELKSLRQSGEVVLFLMQTPIHLPGKVKYVCDFQVFWADGSVTFEDVKGMRTPVYNIKKNKLKPNIHFK